MAKRLLVALFAAALSAPPAFSQDQPSTLQKPLLSTGSATLQTPGSPSSGANIPKMPGMPKMPGISSSFPGVGKLPSGFSLPKIAYNHFKNMTYKSDLERDGICVEAIGKFCADVQWGDGALAHCLRDKASRAKRNHEGNVLSEACQKSVLGFFIAAAHHKPSPPPVSQPEKAHTGLSVSPTRDFRKYCSEDIKKVCLGKYGPQLTQCLKDHKEELDAKCAGEVSKMQVHEAKDITLDGTLFESCAGDLKNIEECAKIKAVGAFQGLANGAKKACLRRHRKELSDDCANKLFVREQQDAESITFDQDTFVACKAEIQDFCKGVPTTKGKMQHCLWLNKGKTGFGEECKTKLTKRVKRSVADFRLDYGIAMKCRTTIRALCYDEQHTAEGSDAVSLFGKTSTGNKAGMVLSCLKKRYEDIDDKACKEQVARVTSIHSEHADAAKPLHRKCDDDIQEFCQDKKPGFVHTCLRQHLDKISEGCRQMEIIQGAVEAHDISMKKGLHMACAQIIKSHCNEVDGGKGLVIQCLQDHMKDTTVPTECRMAITDDLQASNHDWRLKYGLKNHCKKDATNLCNEELLEGGAKLISCLTNKLKEIQSEACSVEMKTYVKQGLDNIKLAPYTYSKCVDDVRYLCPDVVPGSGRVHKCLLAQKNYLSPECGTAEFQIQKLKSEDITLSIAASTACKEDMNKYCHSVTPGDGAMWKCLEETVPDRPASANCKKSVQAHIRLKNSEFYLNPTLSRVCWKEADKLCPGELDKSKLNNLRSEGRTISCLIKNRGNITDTACRDSLVRKQLQRLESLDNDPVAEAVCSMDAATYCSEELEIAPRKVRPCLRKNYEFLTEECKKVAKSSMVQMSERLDVNKVLHTACKPAVKKLCNDVSVGMKIGCLLDHLHSKDMDATCFKELEKEQAKRSKSIDFNPNLAKACVADLQALRKSQSCTGMSSITCLTHHRAQLKNTICKGQVLKVMQRQSNDYRAKPEMTKYCTADVKRLCDGIAPGSGRVHECLRKNLDTITNPTCAKMVANVQKAEAEDVTLNPAIRKHCVNERKGYCSHVEHGDSRVLLCLNMNKAKEGFSVACRKALLPVKIDKAKVKALKDGDNLRVQAAVANALADIKTRIYKLGGFSEDSSMTFLVGTLIGMLTGVALLGLVIFISCRSCRGRYAEVPDTMAA